MSELKYVGKETVRALGRDIVTGKARYTGDFRLPGMRYGKILRSPHPYARILSIDTSRAKAMEGAMAWSMVKTGVRISYSTSIFFMASE